MTYKFGRGSLRKLEGVHPDLVKVTHRAIEVTHQDFTVHDGVRTERQQKINVSTGASQTLASKHLIQQDGFGHALDLVPWIAGKLRWKEVPCCVVAEAIRQAAREQRVAILWGGCWQRLDDDVRDPSLMIEEYVTKRRRQGRRPFVDAAHFEVM